MNDTAMVEYLLRQYAVNFAAHRETWDNGLAAYYLGKAEMAQKIIEERFGMTLRETGTEYIAENSVCGVRVKK